MTGSRSRLAAVLASFILLAASLVGLSGAASAAPPEAAGDEPTAMATARRTGQPVEILAERTETRQVFAQPDGNHRLVTSARPTRVRQGSAWVDVQPRLARRTDGTVGPIASAVDLAFSGGGDAPLVRIAEDGVALTYTWPAPLPAPTVSGATATYADVIPGVDLKLTSSADGFSQVLVVKTAETASRPELSGLRLGTEVTGGTLTIDKSGNLAVIADDGAPAFHGNTPQMWDSSGTPADDGDRLTGPMTGDAISTLATSLVPAPNSGPNRTNRASRAALVLTPDPEFLRDPGLVFPVYIDPPMHAAGRLAFTYVSKHFKDQKYYNTSDVAKVGYYNDPNVPSGPTSDTYRSFFRMDTAPVNGKTIHSATFRTFEVHSWSCSPRRVQLWMTSAIGAGTTWNAQPAWSRLISEVNVAKGYNTSCNDGGVDFNATSAVVQAAASRWSNLTLGLRAADESDTYGWKKFRNNPVLEITYNSTPNVPDQLSTEVGASMGVSCASGTATPYVTTLTPRLRARVSDPDAGKGQTVRAQFELYVTDGTMLARYETPFVSSGTTVSVPVLAGTLTDGATVSWRVRAQDGLTDGDWSPWCALIVDQDRPGSAPRVSSPDYPETPEQGDPIPSGGVGRMGAFTLSPGSGDDDIGGYLFALNSDAPGAATPVTAAADGTATIRVTPQLSLLNTLYVWSRDKAGNIGPFKRYEFSVLPATPPVGHWKLDEATGTVAADSSGNGHDATLGAGSTWTTGGRVNRAIRMNGADRAGAITAGPVIRTDRNFTVAAWALLTDRSVHHTILSQDGVSRSGFYLQYSLPHDRWALVMTSADTNGAVTYPAATSDAPPQLGVWTHLAATFDAATGRLRLFVDGRPQAATAVQSTPWNAAGGFAIGTAWAGDADDAKVWDRVVGDEEIAQLANRPVILEGHWRFDETSGTTVADSSGKGRHGTAGSGVTWSDGWIGGAGRFTGGNVTTTGPAIRTDRSFTVAAWVRLNDKAEWRTAVSQDGVHRSGFYLQYSKPHDSWALVMTSADSTGAVTYDVAADAVPPKLDAWTHLAATYDAAAGRIKLYVDGDEVASAAHLTPWNAGGRLAIGRSMSGDPWLGQIDDVRVYTGTLTEDEIYNLAVQ
ncbi:LamG-like jellyroll fold domain-containing protein [Nonomuraea jiangxiensis]|uniref:Concanavalin A-like lectin/glucanases superfamily protein n=1 Tax=Nonomuraea jiangxiensis TaxID=633440 RepID=A0A1G8QDI3_9ACTN|nr:LamG-like jellyroll fold domain-containing protein [Nonomuraea jiangxiensis]SDJ02767.1 Concanavalin A-like lectin/glucanases superfamily protein [Nonomuraea jiangxiensis]